MDAAPPYFGVSTAAANTIAIAHTFLPKRINFSFFYSPHASCFSTLHICNDRGCGGANRRLKAYSNQRQSISTSSSSSSSLLKNKSSSSSSTTSSTRKTVEEHRRQQRHKQKSGEMAAEECVPSAEEASISVRTLYQNGDPLGRRELGKCVVRWISQGMRSMASDLASMEILGEFSELRQRLGLGVGAVATSSVPNGNGTGTGSLAFVIQAQPYLNAIPMPKGLEALCFKVCTHYPTLFDHFQRELRDILQDLQRKSVFPDWRATESWRLLKEFASSTQHRAAVRKMSGTKNMHGGLGMQLEKATVVQAKIEDFVNHMSELLRIERDAELEFTQEELNAVPHPDENSDSLKPIEYLVSHGQSQQEQCDTICNLNAISSSTGLGGMHLVLFRVEGSNRLPPTTLSPGDMVCVRTCNSRGAGATSCMQGFVNNLGEDGCSITVALESRHGDPTFSKLFGKSVRIDRIHGLADALTYERNCEALMLLQKSGLHKKNPSLAVVATLFGEKEDLVWLEENKIVEWSEADVDVLIREESFDNSQIRAITLGLNKKRPLLVIQGPPGTGKTGLLTKLVSLAVRQGERVLVTSPTNAAVDNMVERLSNLELNIVRVGNPARISASVASKSLGQIVNDKLAVFKKEFERRKSDLRKDLRHCLKNDSLAAGIRQLLKQLGKTLKRKERDTIKEVLSRSQVVLSTNTGCGDPLIRRLDSFDLVVIDEAGQAIEPSCWIPILQGKRCILAGDQCQLAPVVLSKSAMDGGLGISLLERASALHDGVLVTKLTVQYRMHEAICSWASKEMYGGTLESSASVASHLLVDSPFVKVTWITQCPLLLLDTRMPYGSLYAGCEEHLDPAGTGSFYNEGEADIVVQHVFNLIYSGVSPNAIAVQSPYIAQVKLLRDRLDTFPGATGVEVATIDSFQGREADAVIISMVRSNTLGAVGFLGDSRRMNVAITRARKHVAVVCDSSTICHNSFLARLLRHIRRFGRVKHAEPGSFGGFGVSCNPMLPSIG
ncbi:DNA-binding protein SMUBP-2 isoform X2 [Dendrobium catenatum]|uniref:DNA-binding protein SMUBP-2 isoform X2 n=1 Tax=Dendrobium catenatum TaxID=906689 RepID=UPI0010A0AE9E|nr:DNA-binding protein SMUBP-2 isoform X2 [Dendrobium catenatum]